MIIACDINVELANILPLARRIRVVLWVALEASFAWLEGGGACGRSRCVSVGTSTLVALWLLQS